MMNFPGAQFNPSMYGFDVNSPFPPNLQNGATPQSHTAQQQQQQHFSAQQQQQQQPFTPGSLIPAKRPHDGMSGSPLQQLQQSRSQTPSYNNFPSQQPQFPNAPTPYQHLQQQPGSNDATPSPTMQTQQFRPPHQQQQQRMNNASPSPFAGQQQQQQQQQGNYATQMSPGAQGQGNNLQQGGNMAQFGQQYGMLNPSMSMAGMNPAMQAQLNSMGNMQSNAHRAYQMKLLQHQQQLRQGMMAPRPGGGQPNQMNNLNNAAQQPGPQAANGQATSAMQQHQAKRQQFLRTLHSQAQQQGRQFNPQPTIGGKPVDLYTLWTVVTSAGGSQQVDRSGRWAEVAGKMGFMPQQSPSAAEELKMIHATDIGQYEQLWFRMKTQQKHEQARMHAQQMAGVSGGQQQAQSPTKMMPAQAPESSMQQFQQMQQNQQHQHTRQSQQPPQSTPVQANASLPQNGMSTPQQMMGGAAALNHRRNSSIKKSEQVAPQPGSHPGTTGSPLATKQQQQQQQRPPSAKEESVGPVMKSEESQSTNYEPLQLAVGTDGGYDIAALADLGNTISRAMPNHPSVDEMGAIDIKAISLSLASGIHGEVRYALDTLVIISHDQRVALNLEQCEDLLDIIVDCAEDQSEALSEDAAEVSDALDLAAYEDILRSAKAEADTLQEVPEFGTQAYDLDRAADKLIAITTILRNFSFYEFNHRLLTSHCLVKWLSNTIRLLGTRNMLLRTYYNAQDFYKDMIIFLSNVTQSLELPSRDDALHILHFLLAFAPQPSPSYSDKRGKVRFASFVPANHKYLPPAVDCLAKLLARQDPNRMLYKSIFTASSSSLAGSDVPLDLLTQAFALSISVLPDRTKGALGNTMQLRIVEARKAYLTQGMLAADILTTLAPSNESGLARAWIESEDGWAVGLLNLAALLSVDRTQGNAPKGRELGMDTESFKLITHRALTMMKRLAEKAGRGSLQNLQRAMTKGARNGATNGIHDDEDDYLDQISQQPKWEGIPQGHAILGALMMPNTDKVALGLLCGLHEMAMQQNS